MCMFGALMYLCENSVFHMLMYFGGCGFYFRERKR
jgi:hypothetical protein